MNNNNYFYLGCMVDIQTKCRQDLLSVIMSLFSKEEDLVVRSTSKIYIFGCFILSYSYHQNKMNPHYFYIQSIDIPMGEKDMDNFVIAACKKRDVKRIHSESNDLVSFYSIIIPLKVFFNILPQLYLLLYCSI